jgi:uroporphyrinogen III methyltransferase / synthase
MVRNGAVYLVGAGPGDPDLITVRGLELLLSADVVLHDELVPAELCARVAPERLEYVGKRGSDPAEKQLKQSAIDARMIELARSGKQVVRLKGGDPFLFGRGSEEAQALASAGIEFEVVPGVTSPLAAAAYAGISLTHRDLASSVVFLSGTTREKADFDFAELRGHSGSVVILMGLARLRSLSSSLVTLGGRSPATPTAVIQSATRPDQRVVVGTLADIADRVRDAGIGTPALVIVGEVVRLRETMSWFEQRPLFGKRVLVPRSEAQASRTATLLRRRGAMPIELPLIDVRPVSERGPVAAALQALADHDVVVFTSENTVTYLARELDARGLDARAFGKARVAAVGEGTARALRAIGIRADITPPRFRAEALAEVVLDDLTRTLGSPEGARVLLPRARVAREVLPELLRNRGVVVEVVALYETLPVGNPQRAEIAALFASRSVDAVLLLSGSMVDSLALLLGPDEKALLEGVTLASIGPITTQAAERHGLHVATTASEATVESLLDALAAVAPAADSR